MSTVLKLQRSLAGAPQVLGYNQTKSVLFEVPLTPDLDRLFAGRDKVYVKATVRNKGGTQRVEVLNTTRAQDW